MEMNKRYVRNLYLEFRLSDANVRLLKQKIITEHGVFTIDEAYGLNAGRNDDNDSKECVICLTEPKSALAKPCKHVSTCIDCANVIMSSNRTCPMCRQ